MHNRLLQNKSFIRWRLFPSEEDHLYWEAYIREHSELKKEFDKAIRIIKSIKLNTQKLSPEEKQDIFKLIQKDIERRNRKKRYYLFTGVSAVACIALVLVLLRFTVFIPQNEVPEPVSVTVRDDMADSKEIQLILADDKMIMIENESDILYNKQGEIIINESVSEEQIKTDKNKVATARLNTLVVPKGRRSNLTLSDGTRVWINSGTVLKFPAEFDEEKREIWVNGEMYIEVAKDKSRPFYVNTSRMKVNVLGTRFNVSAYPEDREYSVVLVEGSVNVDVENNKYELLPDQRLLLADNQVSTQEINVYDYISWKDGLLQFSREPLSDILTRLSRYYDIDIVCDEQVRDMQCNGKLVLFDNIEDVLETIYNTIPIKYTLHENYVKIMKR